MKLRFVVPTWNGAYRQSGWWHVLDGLNYPDLIDCPYMPRPRHRGGFYIPQLMRWLKEKTN